jgi:hypothetical protein
MTEKRKRRGSGNDGMDAGVLRMDSRFRGNDGKAEKTGERE